MTTSRHGTERGAALVVAVLLTAALSVAVGALALLAMIEGRVAAAARDRLEATLAVQTGIELVTAALTAEPDFTAVRDGTSALPPSGTGTHAVRDAVLDVAGLTRELERRRSALLPPASAAAWRPYVWGRVTELLGDSEADGPGQAWIVAWVRTDDAAALGPGRLEVAVEARGAGGARAGVVAVVERRAAGAAVASAWPDVGFAPPG